MEKGRSEHPERAEHEAKCRRCGRCCRYKIAPLGAFGPVAFTPFHCPWLSRKTRLCSVYEERLERCATCLSLEQAAERRVLPADCPYVAELAGYRGPVESPGFFEDDRRARFYAERLGVSDGEYEAVRRDVLRGEWC